MWPDLFLKIESEPNLILTDLNPHIEHIGSTSIPGIAAKPTIDILIGLYHSIDLDKTIAPIQNRGYIYYEAFESSMPYRRLFVRLKNKLDCKIFKSIYSDLTSIPHEEIHQKSMSHTHIWKHGSQDYMRHLAFRDYLKEHPEAISKYEALKRKLSKKNWQDGLEYNDGKNNFIKDIE